MKNIKSIFAGLSALVGTFVLIGSVLSPLVSADSGWGVLTETTTVNQSDEQWYDLSSSSTGQYQAGVAEGGGIYVSSDYGQTWTNETANDSYNNDDWNGVAISATGQYITAVNDDGGDGIYVSSDYGQTWTDEATTFSGYGASVSATGQYQAVSGDDSIDGIYVSSDYGQTWTNETTSGQLSSVDWDMISMSSTGQYLLASTDGEGLYVSSDYGQSWTDEATSSPIGSDYVWKPAMSSSGQTMYAADYDSGDLYSSSDYGQTWAQVQTGLNISGQDIYFTTTSSSGKDIVMAGYEGDVYSSSDSGQTWTDMTTGTGIHTVYPVTISGSGEYITAGVYGGGLYVGQNASLAPVVSANLTNSSNNAAVNLTTPTGTSITCDSPVTAASLAVQDSNYSYPLGLIDLCYTTINQSDQVSLTFVTSLTPSQVTARDYNLSTHQWITIPGAVVTETTYNGQAALRLTYNISSSSPLNSSTTPGLITDPVGLAVTSTPASPAAPDTGFGTPNSNAARTLSILAGSAAVSLLGYGLRLRQKL